MYFLKKKVRNKARVEGSICEAYITEEMVTFCSMYFDDNFETKFTRKSRNFDGGDVESASRLSIFSQPGSAFGGSQQRFLTDKEYDAALIYALLNCDEVTPFTREFERELYEKDTDMTNEELQRKTESSFSNWFKK